MVELKLSKVSEIKKTRELKPDLWWKEPKTQRAGFARQLTALPVADKHAAESVSHSHFYLGR